MQAISRNLNQFLIENFNTLLRQEEKALSLYGEGILSIYEFHVIDAAYSLKAEKNNTMGEISRKLGVTMGTLTTAAKTLEKKGFVKRVKKGRDRRQVWLEPTALSEQPFLEHRRFHEEMVRAVMERLNPEQLAVLDEALRVLADYFSSVTPAVREQPAAAAQPFKNLDII